MNINKGNVFKHPTTSGHIKILEIDYFGMSTLYAKCRVHINKDDNVGRNRYMKVDVLRKLERVQ